MRTIFALVLTFMLAVGCSQEPIEEIHATQGATPEATPIEIPPGSWPWWRGESRNNQVLDETVDFQWSGQPHVVWSDKIQGLGHSSPIVVGDKVLITTADEKQETKSLLCFDIATGKPLWTKVIHQGAFQRTHNKNSQASATPASDGKYVFTAFVVKDSLYVTAVDLNGQVVWQKEAGPFRSQHGYGSSPLIHEANVIVLADSDGPGFLAALRRDTGEISWRVARASSPSYGTPTLANVAGKEQVLVGGTGITAGYDPATGEMFWEANGPANTTANTPCATGDLVFASGGYPQTGVMAIRADGSNNVTQTHEQWRAREKIYVPTPIVFDGKLMAVSDDGIGLAYDIESGERVTRKRIGGNFSASLTRYGNVMLVPDEQGKMYVFEATPEFNEVASFQLEGNGFASPVFAQGKLFWRTSTHLYCLSPEKVSP
ncbi:PQQ-binding-like beta-propeller repeat protein [Blastopirellula marina]|nr:PQQ-binding-like beta-propeller repeat protein [Blastopirellula marina]